MGKRKRIHSDQKSKGGRPPKKSRKSINSGRKRVSVENSCKRTLYNRVQELLKSNDLSVLELAAKLGRKKANVNNIDEGNVSSNNSDISDNVPNPDPSQNFDSNKELFRHCDESALAFFLEYDYSVNQYKALVHDTHERKTYIYPAYEFVKKEMAKCMPKNVSLSEVEVSVPLQDILNKSAERLCERICTDWSEYDLLNLELITTVDFDSSSGHTNPHQRYENIENTNKNAQESLFVSSMIVIKLRSTVSSQYSWINPTPQSYRFCRPLKLAMKKENRDVIISEHNLLSTSIRLLLPHRFKLQNGKSVKVKYHVSQTLYDGKCVNEITGNTATSRCPMCKKSVHDFGNLNDTFKVKRESNLKYGLGLLHCEIKSYEHLIHIGYRLTIQSWDVREHLKGKIYLLFYV